MEYTDKNTYSCFKIYVVIGNNHLGKNMKLFTTHQICSISIISMTKDPSISKFNILIDL